MPGNPLAMCYCYTCDRDISSMGIMRHRLMHRHRREDCKILYCTQGLIEHQFSKQTDHYPVDRCTRIKPRLSGFLCNCGRTVLGDDECMRHFERSMDELEAELREGRIVMLGQTASAGQT